VRREQRANLGKRSGAGVFERSGLQGAIPGVRPYDKARTRRTRALCTALAPRVQTVKRAGGIWRPRQRLWELSWDAVRTLGLHGRIVE
jgi:hypothetical protein